jgi:hypothetical protein
VNREVCFHLPFFTLKALTAVSRGPCTANVQPRLYTSPLPQPRPLQRAQHPRSGHFQVAPVRSTGFSLYSSSFPLLRVLRDPASVTSV